MRPWLGVFIVGFLFVSNGLVRAQDDDEEGFRPGIVLELTAREGPPIRRVAASLSLAWKSTPVDARLTPGPFTAQWTGSLYLHKAGEYRFFAFGNAMVTGRIGKMQVFEDQQVRESWIESRPMNLAEGFQSLEFQVKTNAEAAQVGFFWSGPGFDLEPIPSRWLFHSKEKTPSELFKRGEMLARALRCEACHGGDKSLPPGPDLTKLAGTVPRGWLRDWLGKHAGQVQDEKLGRRMPLFAMSDQERDDIVAYLLASSKPVQLPIAEPPAKKSTKKTKAGEEASTPKDGQTLFTTLGCLACHTWKDVGLAGWFTGGDLSRIGEKHSKAFFLQWLKDPGSLNADHRMPIFELSDEERFSLADFLSKQTSENKKVIHDSKETANHAILLGQTALAGYRCGACHRLPSANEEKEPSAQAKLDSLKAESAWNNACSVVGRTPNDRQPNYALTKDDAAAVQEYFRRRHTSGKFPNANTPSSRAQLQENNCLQCHAREPGLANRASLKDHLPLVAKQHPKLASLLPAMAPPALSSAGDKLTEQALIDAITRKGPAHRPYLAVRMPRFRMTDAEVKSIVELFAQEDRIPDRPKKVVVRTDTEKLLFTNAGGRLLSSDGFGCVSCHQVGSVMPGTTQLNARGPDLAMLGNRVRKEWFDRFVRDPARIVPNMEMPSVQLAVRGVLHEKLGDQLEAVWQVLNTPGFEPPPPNPVRVLRQTGTDKNAEPMVVTDQIAWDKRTLVLPVLIGLANRHNVLFDLEENRLLAWTVGDLARQRTKGKAWFWESAGAKVFEPNVQGSEIEIVGAKNEPLAQFTTELDALEAKNGTLTLRHRLRFSRNTPSSFTREFTPTATGFRQSITMHGLPADTLLRFHLMSPELARQTRNSDEANVLVLSKPAPIALLWSGPRNVRWNSQGFFEIPTSDKPVSLSIDYRYDLPVDPFVPVAPPKDAAKAKTTPVEVGPGLVGIRLPLPPDIMPTALAWRPDGKLVFTSLRGQVFEARDTDADEFEDELHTLADGLPAPYGINTGLNFVDVSAKLGLLRIHDNPKLQKRIETVASGWGYTTDYHDWAVGLPRGSDGEYYLGIPCQQDKRSAAGAKHHGSVLKLVPREPTGDNPRRFTLEPISFGHRFPMGLALNRAGDLFVTDNQGNYNPFNELNHVRPGAHFGFVNALEKGKPAPPLEPPAIDIPHPWTRSVNGITFLNSPESKKAFGPFEGHLVGCEYDTRQLIRMSLQKVGDTYQGAAYPLSVSAKKVEDGLLGPISCAVGPNGDLYVGGIRDSGWGAGNNIGEIVRVRFDFAKMPNGIAEVRATSDGFEIDFLKPVEPNKAKDLANYAIQSYRREATPAYGGPDLDRRTEKVTTVDLASNGRGARIRLAEMRRGYVYEIRVRNLANEFHPAEAHYTMRSIPSSP